MEVDPDEGYAVQLVAARNNGTPTYELDAVSGGQGSFVTLNETGYLTIDAGVTETDTFFIDVSFVSIGQTLQQLQETPHYESTSAAECVCREPC